MDMLPYLRWLQNGGGAVVSYGFDQHLSTGWFATGSQPPVEAMMEVWPYGPGLRLSRCPGPAFVFTN